jgi:hypothetical protein
MPVTRSARTSASPVSKPVLHNSFRRSRTLSAEFEVAKDAELSLPLHTAFVYTRMSLLHREPGGSPLEDDSVLEHLLGTGEATHERFSASARTHGNQMPHPKLTRGLKERHIRMISIAGMIGVRLPLPIPKVWPPIRYSSDGSIFVVRSSSGKRGSNRRIAWLLRGLNFYHHPILWLISVLRWAWLHAQVTPDFSFRFYRELKPDFPSISCIHIRRDERFVKPIFVNELRSAQADYPFLPVCQCREAS